MHWGGGHGGGGWHGGMLQGRLGEYLDEDVIGRPYNHKVVTRLLSYLRPYPRPLTVSLIAMVMFSLTTVATPWLIKFGIDRLLASRNMAAMTLPLTLFAIVQIVGFGANYIHLVLLARISQGILYTLREQLFGHLQRLSISFTDRNEVGRVMSRVQNDVSQLQEFLSTVVLTLGELLSLGGIVVAMFLLEARLALITLSVVPLLFIALAVWQRRAWRSFMRVRRAISVVNAGLQENISGVRVVQAMNREGVNLRQFEGVNREHFQANLQASRMASALLPVVEVLSAVSIGLVVVFGGWQMMEGGLAVGTVVAFILYIQRFYDPIRMLTMQYTQFQRAMTSGVRIFELLDTQPEVQDAPDSMDLPPLKGDIRLENVRFSYKPEQEVLKGIDLEIKAGETVALVGPSGAGKTTLASLIARFYDVTGGRILVDGYDLRKVRRASLARQMAMVLQEPFLFAGTIKENIKFNHTEATDQQVEAAARVAGAHDFIARLALGYETKLEERGQTLSLGQRQLVSLARAVLANPRILLLDEATANIDTQTEHLTQKALARVLRGRTTVVIAHRLSTVRAADRIVVIEKGRIQEEGTHQELLARGGRYSHLYTTYFSGLQPSPAPT